MVPKASDHKGHWSPLLSLHSLAKASHMATPAPANVSYRIPPGGEPQGQGGEQGISCTNNTPEFHSQVYAQTNPKQALKQIHVHSCSQRHYSQNVAKTCGNSPNIHPQLNG